MCPRIVLAVSLLVGTAFAAAPPARHSAAQRLLLQGRDALLEQMREQQEKKNLALAEKLCRGALDVEVMVYGPVSMPVVGTKKILAELCEQREDWKAAVGLMKEREQALALLWGKGHFRARDARLETEEVATRSRLTPEQRARLALARELDKSARQLYREGKGREVINSLHRAVALNRDVLGPKSHAYAKSLGELAYYMMLLGEPNTAV